MHVQILCLCESKKKETFNMLGTVWIQSSAMFNVDKTHKYQVQAHEDTRYRDTQGRS